MGKTKIEWTEHTWNPFTGCSVASRGCRNCYARRIAESMKNRGVQKYWRGFKPTVHYDELEEPSKWRRPRMVFVCSMSDVFNENFKDEDIEKLFDVMNKNRNHVFQILTKRADRMAAFIKHHPIQDHIWVGVTVEERAAKWRVDELRSIKARTRFISCEPILEEVALDLNGIHWLIAGGETGINSRECQAEWLFSLCEQAGHAKIPFFLKQIGDNSDIENPEVTIDGKRNILRGKTYTAMPIPKGHQESLF